MSEKRRTSREMFPLIEEYVSGSYTQQSFCEEHGLSLGQLAYWRAKYGREHGKEAGTFIEISSDFSPPSASFAEITYPEGVRLRFFSAVSPVYLSELIGPSGRSR